MPYLTRGQGFFELEPFASDHMMTGSGTLVSDGLVANTYGNTIVQRGTILARITDSTRPTYEQLVVKLAAPTYGPGSDVPIGVLRDTVDLSFGPHNVAFVTHGTVKKQIAIENGARGVSAATQATLSHIIWI